MNKPTPAQLKAEIETGPLAAALASAWATVFPSEPEPSPGTAAHARWQRIQSRFGTLTPDASETIRVILHDRTRASRTVPKTITLSDLPSRGFQPASIANVFNHQRFADFRDIVNNQDRPGATEMATLFAATGVITAGDLTVFTDYLAEETSETCSLIEAKQWVVDIDLIHQAKAVQ